MAGTYTFPAAPGGTRDLSVTIRARAGTPANAVVERTLTIRSTTRPTIRDTVKATVTRR